VGGGGAYLFHVCGGPGGEPLGSVNFLEWDGSASKWHIPFLEPSPSCRTKHMKNGIELLASTNS
jgi:hypothetical protein